MATMQSDYRCTPATLAALDTHLQQEGCRFIPLDPPPRGYPEWTIFSPMGKANAITPIAKSSHPSLPADTTDIIVSIQFQDWVKTFPLSYGRIQFSMALIVETGLLKNGAIPLGEPLNPLRKISIPNPLRAAAFPLITASLLLGILAVGIVVGDRSQDNLAALAIFFGAISLALLIAAIRNVLAGKKTASDIRANP